MIIVTLAGGLGNQLFQYAAARRLSLAMKTELKLDIITRLYNPVIGGLYELEPFNIQAGIASPADIIESLEDAKTGMSRLYHTSRNRLKMVLKVDYFYNSKSLQR